LITNRSPFDINYVSVLYQFHCHRVSWIHRAFCLFVFFPIHFFSGPINQEFNSESTMYICYFICYIGIEFHSVEMDIHSFTPYKKSDEYIQMIDPKLYSTATVFQLPWYFSGSISKSQIHRILFWWQCRYSYTLRQNTIKNSDIISCR
jgi:hypothetical protein